jgi:hypothetical protein
MLKGVKDVMKEPILKTIKNQPKKHLKTRKNKK